MAQLTTLIYTAIRGQLVGTDIYGNRYYRRKGAAHGDATSLRKHEKRWVIYKGLAEPSKVPPEWHGWLHYTVELPPTERTIPHFDWQKDPQPNLTGTPNAYIPPGHINKGAQRSASTSDYQAWKP